MKSLIYLSIGEWHRHQNKGSHVEPFWNAHAALGHSRHILVDRAKTLVAWYHFRCFRYIHSQISRWQFSSFVVFWLLLNGVSSFPFSLSIHRIFHFRAIFRKSPLFPQSWNMSLPISPFVMHLDHRAVITEHQTSQTRGAGCVVLRKIPAAWENWFLGWDTAFVISSGIFPRVPRKAGPLIIISWSAPLVVDIR